jgi:hypothetical protein
MDRESVHHRTVETRNVNVTYDIFGQSAADKLAQINPLGGQGSRVRLDPGHGIRDRHAAGEAFHTNVPRPVVGMELTSHKSPQQRYDHGRLDLPNSNRGLEKPTGDSLQTSFSKDRFILNKAGRRMFPGFLALRATGVILCPQKR